MVSATQNIPTKRQRRGGSVPKAPSAGPIENGASYSLEDFKARTRWSNHAIRTAKRNGLRVILTGGTGFVRGDDFNDYLKKLAGNNEMPPANGSS